MNAGAHGSDMSEILVKARILFEDGTIEWLTNEEMDFSYRTSVLQKKRPGVCLEAVLQLEQKEREAITAQMQQNKDYRKNTQPYSSPCAGSIFRNPLPNHAGNLVEKAGLKGHQIGGAKVSEMHGNFIVNAGGATAKDVLDLIEYVKKTKSVSSMMLTCIQKLKSSEGIVKRFSDYMSSCDILLTNVKRHHSMPFVFQSDECQAVSFLVRWTGSEPKS